MIFKEVLIILNLLILALTQDCSINLTSYSRDPTILNTLNGNVKGLCNLVTINDPDSGNSTRNVLSWKAIPYAEPPVRELRFKKPVPVRSWTDTKNGTVFSNRCMQNTMGPFGSGSPVSEDCLYLNIFVRAESYLDYQFGRGQKKPIYVFIHGGRFIVGSGSDSEIDPSINVALMDVIYVTINYRVGPFGFMHLGNTDISGNQGFLDQSLALKWVYDNADRFGGDRNKITLGGQSAGSVSASYHLIYPPSWNYFNSMILQSGTLLYVGMDLFTSDELSRRTKGVFDSLGCNFNSLNNTAYLQCVQNLNPSSILTATDTYAKNNILSAIEPTFQLVLDGVEFKEPIKNAIRGGRFKRVNLLTGYTSDEAAFQLALSGYFGTNPNLLQNPVANLSIFTQYITEYFTYYPRYPTLDNGIFAGKVLKEFTSNSTTSNYFNTLIQIFSELTFICPTIDLASIYAKSSSNVYLYSFDQLRSFGNYPPSYGVVHSGDIAFVFGSPLNARVSSGPSGPQRFTDDEKRFAKQIITYWTNFVKTGNPNFGELKSTFRFNYWPSYYNQNETYNTPNTSVWSLVYDFLFNIFKYFSPTSANMYENKHLILKFNQTRTANRFTYLNNDRRCSFWRNSNNF